MAERVEAGTVLPDAVQELNNSAPRELRCLLREALSAKDPAGLMVDLVRVRQEVRVGWRSFLSVTLYPGILFLFALGICLAFSFLMRNMVDLDWMDSFGIAGTDQIRATIDDQHQAIVGISVIVVWVGLVLATVMLFGPSWATVAVLGGMVVIGKPLRWLNLQELLQRYQLFVDQGIEATELPAVVARSFSRSSQAVVAGAIAQRIASGVPIGRALSRSVLSDGLCRPALLMLDERKDNFGNAFGETARLLGTMTSQRCATLGAMIPLLVLAAVGTLIWASLSSYVLGLTPLIRMLSSLI